MDLASALPIVLVTLSLGLGAATTVDEIKIRWPNGKVETMTKVAANRVVKIVEK